MGLFVLLAAVPLIEIALFVTVGAWLGLWLTLAIVLGTAILGGMVIRLQGQRSVQDLRGSIRMGDPLRPMAHGALIVAAGFLLILPGFFTDTLGLVLLLPPVRQGLIALLARRMNVRANVFETSKAGPRQDGVVIDGEFIELENDPPPRPGSSGWTRH